MEARETTELLDEDAAPAPPAKPKTVTVLILLTVAAAALAFLGAYPATDALAQAAIIHPVSHSPDPRPRLAGFLFAGLVVLFGLIAALMRGLTWYQFHKMEATFDAEGPADEL